MLLRQGNVVNFYSGFANNWVNNHMLSEKDIMAISVGINFFEAIPITLSWKIKFLQNTIEAIPLDTIKWVHELQNHYFSLFKRELISVEIPFIKTTNPLSPAADLVTDHG